ncbi:AglZ/HisF2 family acetamidino modification protein [Pontibacter cellulosilyticus]|uniref:imidazole glycerol-phosphate synthase n=1 Tax=Pontibacter cellulosilyticus TaxID=1720253 RepID=A0A923SLY1_9BACT|nr:AglZ/HisF2 family acetamidino modification protein [Pontibacter cellulosilyticus]MBC5991615.1 imidazole glycerol phosphate synthase subunit HisF [Pontibacter cellulosilyticus]
MRRIRVIPILLLHNEGLVKSVKFKDYKYIGDPINAVKIFNDKEVDEIAIIDITATAQKRKPDLARIRALASECFMPMAYGGGISALDEIKSIFYAGVEKIILNYAAYQNIDLVSEAASIFGSQSIVASVDVKKNFFGKYKVYTMNGSEALTLSPEQYAKRLEDAGAGEILLNSIENDGKQNGYDTELIKRVADAVNIPIVAAGGAGSVHDFYNAVEVGASAVAAGSMFVFHGSHRAVLINYPDQAELASKLFNLLD